MCAGDTEKTQKGSLSAEGDNLSSRSSSNNDSQICAKISQKSLTNSPEIAFKDLPGDTDLGDREENSKSPLPESVASNRENLNIEIWKECRNVVTSAFNLRFQIWSINFGASLVIASQGLSSTHYFLLFAPSCLALLTFILDYGYFLQFHLKVEAQACALEEKLGFNYSRPLDSTHRKGRQRRGKRWVLFYGPWGAISGFFNGLYVYHQYSIKLDTYGIAFISFIGLIFPIIFYIFIYNRRRVEW